MSERRQPVDNRLDHLYMKNMRCPYCHTRMPKGTSKCPTCGLTKEQMYHARISKARHRKKQAVLYSKVRPSHIPFWKMGIGGMLGFLGLHCFFSKRYWRGVIILTCTILFIISSFVFHGEYTNPHTGEVVAPHPWREMFEIKTYIFPPDLFGLTAIVMWIWDWFAILFGGFKYPVVVEETQPQ